MVFDRLSVLVIRICVHGGRRALQQPSTTRRLRGAPSRAARSSLRLCRRRWRRSIDDVRAGRKRFVPYQSLKLYGATRVA